MGVEVVRVIGKRGLSYRQEENEAAYALDDDGLDHGIFLKRIISLGKYDVCLTEHLSNVIEKSKKVHGVKRIKRQKFPHHCAV